MRELLFITLIVVCTAFTASGQKGKETEKPLLDLTQQEWNQRVADVKRRTGNTIKVGKPVADPRRRRRVRCFTADAFSWKLATGFDSDIGGLICYR